MTTRLARYLRGWIAAGESVPTTQRYSDRTGVNPAEPRADAERPSRALHVTPRQTATVAVAAFFAVAAVLMFAAPASAHSSLVSSTPAGDGTLTTLPSEFSVTTSEALLDINGNGSGFALLVRDAAGLYYGDGCVTVDGAAIRQPAALGEARTYTVAWQALSTDGHTVSGTFPFTWAPVGDATRSTGSIAPPDCNGKFRLNLSGLPSAGTVAASAPAANGQLSAVLWIAGTVLAVGIAAVLTLMATARRGRRAG